MGRMETARRRARTGGQWAEVWSEDKLAREGGGGDERMLLIQRGNTIGRKEDTGKNWSWLKTAKRQGFEVGVRTSVGGKCEVRKRARARLLPSARSGSGSRRGGSTAQLHLVQA